MARAAEQLVDREVRVCTSQLIHMLAGGCAAITADNRDLVDLCEQAIELAAPVDDWEEAATEREWFSDKNGTWRHLRYFATYANARELCESEGINPYQREVFEHWAVTEWFGEKLAAHGEKVDFDFAGMVIWARTSVNQDRAADSVVQQIAAETESTDA